jgi:peptidoglycan/LPS O-acetylase OafA/YrhL
MAAAETNLRFQESGDEAGTAPGDRKFRPDVEGLRAVAVGLVVLYHANVPGVGGGYIGVDVFFLISGFVITGLLLRERAERGTTRLIEFYARRARRIIPAATVVIIATVIAAYHWLGFIRAGQVANDARAAALFVANFHFIALGTNYITAQRPPSPLQNLWTLSVEEQFYAVYPTIVLLLAVVLRRVDFRHKLAAALAVAVAGSLYWSIHLTAVDENRAFFSPFTHAWELALGGLVAVASTKLSELPRSIAAGLTWLGLAAIVAAAFIFDSATAYPGSAALLPVVGTALVIAGGAAVPALGAELVLGLRPVRWLGRLSYSLYLWHWPVLTIAAEKTGKTLSVWRNLVLVLLALGLSIATYVVVENPIRHSRFLAKRHLLSVAFGAALIGLTVGFVAIELRSHP